MHIKRIVKTLFIAVKKMKIWVLIRNYLLYSIYGIIVDN